MNKMKDNNNHYHVRNKSKSAKHKTPVNKKNKQFVNTTTTTAKVASRKNKMNVMGYNNNNKEQLSAHIGSPRTIEYAKLMEKYGDIINMDTPKMKFGLDGNDNDVVNVNKNISDDIGVYHEHRGKCNNTHSKSICGELSKTFNTYNKLNAHSHYHNNNNISNVNCNIYNENDDFSNYATTYTNRNSHTPNNHNHNYNNKIDKLNSDILKLKHKLETAETKVSLLENENNKLKIKLNSFQHTNNNNNNSNTNTNKINEKLIMLIDLFRKYSKKFTQLIPFCVNNNTDALNELKETIMQYNKAVHNEKLLKIFNINNNTKQNINNFDLSEFEPCSVDFYSKYESHINELHLQNEALKKKLNEQLKTNEELQKAFSNEQIKVKELIDKNNILLTKTNETESLKKQLLHLEKDIEYKDKIIAYLESILPKHNTGMYNSNEEDKHNENEDATVVDLENRKDKQEHEEDKIDNNESIDNYIKNNNDNNDNNEVYDYNDINHKENNFNEEEEEVVINSVQQYNNNSNNNVNNVNNIDDNSNRIQNEFDELDKEIFTLKKQLKMMITSK